MKPQKNHPIMTTMYIRFQKKNTKITADSKITNTSCSHITIFMNQKKKYIVPMVQRLFRLRRRIENNDWDFDYNRQHPTEKPRQKTPDISDEEYAEKSKKYSRVLLGQSPVYLSCSVNRALLI